MNSDTYAASGVDIVRAENFVHRLQQSAKRAGHSKLWPAAGGYAAVHPISADRGMAFTTDGVGTKLLVCHQLNCYDTIGIDLVAMCANDLICVGARPTLFLDYLAIGVLNDKICDQIISGIISGCDQAGMLLVGGETAELPDLYAPGHFDLAGFAVGDLTKKELLSGNKILPGHKVIGLASSGIHSNGLTLARKLLPRENWEELLVPTIIYVKPVQDVLAKYRKQVVGIAHITGGGWRNLFRLNPNIGFHITNPLPVPEVLQKIGEQVDKVEMYKTFNMGMGLCLIVTGDTAPIVETLANCGIVSQEVGHVTDYSKTLTSSDLILRGT